MAPTSEYDIGAALATLQWLSSGPLLSGRRGGIATLRRLVVEAALKQEADR